MCCVRLHVLMDSTYCRVDGMVTSKDWVSPTLTQWAGTGAGVVLPVPCLPPQYDSFLWHLLHYNLSYKSFFFAVYSGLILEICFHLPTLTPGGLAEAAWKQKINDDSSRVGRGSSLTWSSEQPQPCLLPQGLTLGKNGQLGTSSSGGLDLSIQPLCLFSALLSQDLLPTPSLQAWGDGWGEIKSLSVYTYARALG